jgi:hypothetical protein
MKLGRSRTALVLPIAMIGTSASPAGSSAIMLHQPNEREEGAMTAPGIQALEYLILNHNSKSVLSVEYSLGIMRIAAKVPMIESLRSIIKSPLGTDDRPSLRFEVYQLVSVSAINTPPKVTSKLIGHGTG